MMPSHWDFLRLVELHKETIRKRWNWRKKRSVFNLTIRIYFTYSVEPHFYNQNIPKARHAISEGQRIAPDEASFFLLRGEIEFYSDNWELALKEVNRGLELDAEDVQLVNLRARCLVKLNRQDEASQTLDYALNRAPENSYSHANKGWVAIEKDEYDKAIEHFKQALRFDPDQCLCKSRFKRIYQRQKLSLSRSLKVFFVDGQNAGKIPLGIYYRYLYSVPNYDLGA